MIPQLGATTSSGPVSPQIPDAARVSRSDPPVLNAATDRPETPRSIDPPEPADKPSALSLPERRDLNPPDPRAPAGPPPAFEASILDRRREEAMSPPSPDLFRPWTAETGSAGIVASDASSRPASDLLLLAEPEAEQRAPGALAVAPDLTPLAGSEDAGKPIDTGSRAATAGEPGDTGRDADDRRGYQVPPSAEQRVEREVATIRRIETPYDTATVDVSR